jgi:hypothetical protein
MAREKEGREEGEERFRAREQELVLLQKNNEGLWARVKVAREEGREEGLREVDAMREEVMDERRRREGREEEVRRLEGEREGWREEKEGLAARVLLLERREEEGERVMVGLRGTNARLKERVQAMVEEREEVKEELALLQVAVAAGREEEGRREEGERERWRLRENVRDLKALLKKKEEEAAAYMKVCSLMRVLDGRESVSFLPPSLPPSFPFYRD